MGRPDARVGGIQFVERSDDEGRAGDPFRHPERPQGTTDEGRLPRPEVTGDEHDVTRRELGREGRPRRFRRVGGVRFDAGPP